MNASTAPVPTYAALVTGGAQRIGRAIVLALAARGYAVAIHANNSRPQAEQLRREILARGGQAAVLIADLADHKAVNRLVPAAASAIGPLTLLVNNACEFEPDRLGELDRSRWDHQFAVNLRAPVFLAQAFAEQAPADAAAAIINLLDQRVLKPTPDFISYTLTKSALLTATRTLAQSLAPRIRVNAVAPGPTLPSARQSPEDFAQQAAATPLRRGPSPEEIAEAVLFLATAPSVTGQVLAVDGGQHLAWQTPDVTSE
jgi:NAD(P)-dependent dehydrogenase (short-subunit alcohol dehydrogenase family)